MTKSIHTLPFQSLASAATPWTVAFAILSILVIRHVNQLRRLIRMGEHLPGPPLQSMHPWVGHRHIYNKSLGTVPNRPHQTRSVDLFVQQSHQYPHLFLLWMMNPYRVPVARLVIILVDPALVHQLLTDPKNTTSITKAKRIFKLGAPLVGDSFMVMDDTPMWKHHRKLTVRAFKQSLLEYSFTQVRQNLEIIFQRWGNQKRSVEMVEFSTKFTLEILGLVAFGCSVGSFDEDSQSTVYGDYQFMLEMVVRWSRVPPGVGWFWRKDNERFQECSQRLDRLIWSIIRERERQQKDGTLDTSRRDILSFLMEADENGQCMERKYLFANTRMFLLAGHETAAGVMAGGFWEIAYNKKVQEKLRREVDACFNEAENGEPTLMDFMKLPYLDLVTREACRKHASAAMGRSILKDLTLRKGDERVVLPKGSVVYIFPQVTQRNSAYYSDPEAFNPERFLEKDRDSPWFPFSYGSRDCLGKPLAVTEFKLVMAYFVRRFILSVSPETIRPIPVSTMTVKLHDVPVQLEPRNLGN